MQRIVIRGTNDVASAVAHRLFTAGYAVVLHDRLHPTTTRRGMAFTDAVYAGYADLAGVTAVRVDDVANVLNMLREHLSLPVVVGDLAALLAIVQPDILIDAQMQKRSQPETQLVVPR